MKVIELYIRIFSDEKNSGRILICYYSCNSYNIMTFDSIYSEYKNNFRKKSLLLSDDILFIITDWL